MATRASFERRDLNWRDVWNRGAEALALLVVVLACASTSSTAPGGGQPG